MKLTHEQKAKLFDALHADGVDNWEGYQQGNYQRAMEEIEAEAQYDENKKVLQPLFGIIEENICVDFPAGREAGANTTITEDGVREVVEFISKNFIPITKE